MEMLGCPGAQKLWGSCSLPAGFVVQPKSPFLHVPPVGSLVEKKKNPNQVQVFAFLLVRAADVFLPLFGW